MRRDLHFGLNDVFFPIPFGGGNIPRQAEVFQGGKSNVVSTTYARFQHAATPDWSVTRLRDVMNFPCLAEPSNSANFDIDDAACAGLQCNSGVATATNGLIETNRSLELAL